MADRVRAVIIDGDKMLMIHHVSPGKDIYVFPGGGVEPRETDTEALARECREEIGADIEIQIGDMCAAYRFEKQRESP